MNRFSKIAMFGALVVMAAGCKPKASATKQEERPIKVKTATAVEASSPRVLALTGSLRGEKESDLAANANGRILQTYVERGDEVKAGALLARLDTRSAALSAQEAKAQAASASQLALTAKQECERAQSLYSKGGISRQELERIESSCATSSLAVSAASARSLLAAQNVGDGIIRAPFGGVIGERYVDSGEYVRADTRVVLLVSVDPLRLEFAVPEAYLAALKLGQEVSFSVAAHKGKSFSGRVKFIGARIRTETRDVVVEAEVPNAERKLLPGMFASVEIALGEEPATKIPRAATFERDGKVFVFAVSEGHAEERVVQVGAFTAEDAIVRNGVKTGERIVSDDLTKLRNGQAVE